MRYWRSFAVASILAVALGPAGSAGCDSPKTPAADGANTPAPADDGGAPPSVEPPAADGAAAPDDGADSPDPVEPSTTDCDGEPCEAPRECISYYGIAGEKGPQFHACEIRCKAGSGAAGCPPDMHCVTVADGPGSVCRPSANDG